MNGTTRVVAPPARPVRRMQFWIVAREGVGLPELLATELVDGRRALGVFSFEEEARLFLRLHARGTWRVRTTGIGELVSILRGPCRGVYLVALDPLPEGRDEALNELLCVDRERFVTFLLRKGSGR